MNKLLKLSKRREKKNVKINKHKKPNMFQTVDAKDFIFIISNGNVS